MSRTTAMYYTICSHLHIDTVIVGEEHPGSPAPALSLRQAWARRRRPGWMQTLLWCLILAGLVTSCTRRSAAPPPTIPSPGPSLRTQYGLASWYGRERHG